MANAPRDNNRIPTALGTLNTDGITPVVIKVNDSTHGLKVDDNTTGVDHSGSTDIRDGNRATGFMGVSSADGVTPVEIYADSSGNLLVNSH